jgi:D-glycero-D-manno-heptose 1,7-bisphosphate phosphatase
MEKMPTSNIEHPTSTLEGKSEFGRRAIFFDRDNTLIINDGYLGDPAGVILMPGAADAVARARALGYAVVTVSNQSGVARGLFDESAVAAVDRRMDELLLADRADALIDLHLYCPYHPQAVVPAYRRKSELRKPSPGMLLLAAEQLKLDLRGSWLIGDAPRDIEAGKRAGCRTILFQPPGVAPSPAAGEKSQAPDFVVYSLADAMDCPGKRLNDAGQAEPQPKIVWTLRDG